MHAQSGVVVLVASVTGGCGADATSTIRGGGGAGWAAPMDRSRLMAGSARLWLELRTASLDACVDATAEGQAPCEVSVVVGGGVAGGAT